MSDFTSILTKYNIPQVPLDTDTPNQTEFSELIPEDERGFISNIAESWKRGKENILSDIAVYEAATGGGNVEDALRYRKKIQYKDIVDPVEGNFFEGLIYKTSKILPGWMESAKKGILPALAGAGIGAGAAAIGGAAIPLPEELVTVPAAAIKGGKIGFTLGNAHFWYKQGAGSMYSDMMEAGYDPKKSLMIAKIAAVPYAALEFLQIKGITPKLKESVEPVLRQTVAKIISKFGKSYLKTLGKEVGEEVAQEIVQIAATDLAGYYSGQGVDIDKDYFIKQAKRLGNVAWESTQAMALLPVPGAAIETSVEAAKESALGEIELDKKLDKQYSEMGQYYELNPFGAEASRGFGFDDNVSILTQDGEGVSVDSSLNGKEAGGRIPTDPLGKLQVALLKSVGVYETISKIRKEELANKFGLSEDRMFEAPTAREGMRAALGAMKGELTDINIDPVENIMSPTDWESLFTEIRDTDKLTHPEKVNVSNALENLIRDGRVPRPYEQKLFAKQFGPMLSGVMEALQNTIEDKPITNKALILDALGIPKATAASMDVSRTLRQNILLIGNPKAWYKGLKDEWKLFLNDKKTAKRLEMEAFTGEYAHLWRRTDLRINEWGDKGSYTSRSEKFPSRAAQKIPLIARSERAYTAGGNLLRVFLFEQIAKEWENREDFHPTAKDYNDLSHVINLLTGEGDIKLLEEYGATLNAVFFAPRLLAGRFQAVFQIFNPKKSWAARKVLAQHMVKFVLVNTIAMKLFGSLPGCSVEEDPRSTDFGKIRFGNTRIDFWGGYQPIVRVVAEIISGKHKTQTGEIIDKNRRDALTTFLQSKLGPVPAATLDFMRGETFYGEERKWSNPDDLTREFYERLTPFVIQDIIDAARYNGMGAAAIVAPLAFHGVGTQSYDQTPGTKLTLQKNTLSQSVFGQNWKDLGAESQAVLREQYPEVSEAEKKLDYEYKSPKYMKRLAEQQAASEKRIIKGLSPSLVKELADYQIKIGGLGRRVASDWYLNDERYEKYEKTTIKALNKVLPAVFKTSQWDKSTFADKQLIIAEVVGEVKDMVRDTIVTEANYKDVKYLLEKE